MPRTGIALSPAGRVQLDRLFFELRAQRIVAEQDFACCQTCGNAELVSMMNADPSRIGYAFYHHQAAQCFDKCDGTYISFGARSEDDADARAVGQRIANTAVRVGLLVAWNGSEATRVYVGETTEAR